MSGKILAIGDSVTNDGRYISFLNSAFALCGRGDISVLNLGVSSETACGLSEPSHPFPRPNAQGRIDRALQMLRPDWVLLCYGINDGIYYPFAEERFAAYRQGMCALVEKVHAAGARAVVLTPPPFDAFSFLGELEQADAPEFSFARPYENYDEVMARYSQWLLEEMPSRAELVIDLRAPLLRDIQARRERDPDTLSGDGIHPNLHGHWVMAQTILRELCNVSLETLENRLLQDDLHFYHLVQERDNLLHCYYKEAVGHDNPYKEAPLSETECTKDAACLTEKIAEYPSAHPRLPESADRWNGYQRELFFFDGFEASLVKPKRMAPQSQWIWRTEFFGAFPSADLAMLEKGYAVAHLHIPNLYGNADAVGLMLRFQAFLCEKYDLAKRAVLFGFSRGGLYAVSYAARHPQNVQSLYLDAPVVDMQSWPGGAGKGVGALKEWMECRCAYGMKSGDEPQWEQLQKSTLDALAAAKLPLILVAGDSDDVVPYEENGALLARLYQNTGAPFQLILKPGIGHHPHSLADPGGIVAFLVSHQTA